MSNSQHTLLKTFVGVVTEIINKYKAIVQFQLDGKTERALLKYDKIKVDDKPLPEGGCIDDHVKLNSQWKFLCHQFDDSGIDRCQWYITCAWEQLLSEGLLECCDTVVNGLYNCTGHVLEIARRQGILMFTNNAGKEENVLFLASKLFIAGKRVSTKMDLCQQPGLEEGRQLCFDAVPCDAESNERQCTWFATVVWKGRKPPMEYDEVRGERKKNDQLSPLAHIKQLTSNPHSLFLRGTGQVLTILNAEYGLVLAMIKPNYFDTVLFHRSHATLFDLSLAKEDLTTVFQEGDQVRLVAAIAPETYGTKWVASQVRVYVDPSVSHQFQH